MQTEQFSGLRNVALAVHQDALDVLPLDAREGRNFRGYRLNSRRLVSESLIASQNLIGIRRLAHIVVGSQFGGGERRRDAAVARKHDDANGLVETPEVPNDVQTTRPAKA